MQLHPAGFAFQPQKHVKNIAVFLRKKSRLGDQLVAFPLLYQLKQSWPDAKISVVSRRNTLNHYAALPWVSQFVHADSIYGQLKAARNADLAICLHESSERYSLATALGGVKSRMGFENGRLFDRFWTHRYPNNLGEYIALSNLKLLATAKDFDFANAMRGGFLELARQSTVSCLPNTIAFMPGGGAGAFKRWPIEHYLRLAELLNAEIGGEVSFSFYLGPQERRERDVVLAQARPNYRVEWCRSVPAIAAGLMRARLVVANDCGPSHIAQCLATPYVGIFNQPNPHWFWTRHGALSVVPDNGTSDITSIAPKRVAIACHAILSMTAPPR